MLWSISTSIIIRINSILCSLELSHRINKSLLGYLSQFLNLDFGFFFNSFQLFLMLSDYILVKILVVINTFVICWSLLPLEKLWSSQSLIVIICGERNNCFNFGTWLRFGFEVILEIDKLFMLPARILILIN